MVWGPAGARAGLWALGFWSKARAQPPPNKLNATKVAMIHLGVSENRGPQYSTLNSRILIIRIPKQSTLIFGKSHIFGTPNLTPTLNASLPTVITGHMSEVNRAKVACNRMPYPKP